MGIANDDPRTNDPKQPCPGENGTQGHSFRGRAAGMPSISVPNSSRSSQNVLGTLKTKADEEETYLQVTCVRPAGWGWGRVGVGVPLGLRTPKVLGVEWRGGGIRGKGATCLFSSCGSLRTHSIPGASE